MKVEKDAIEVRVVEPNRSCERFFILLSISIVLDCEASVTLSMVRFFSSVRVVKGLKSCTLRHLLMVSS